MKDHTENKTIETKIASLSLGEGGILKLTIDYKNDLTIHDVKELIAAKITITREERVAVLVNSINYKIPSRETRIYIAGEGVARMVKAMAFLITNPVTRIGANFFMKINKPRFPFKIFTDEKEAIEWLKRFLA